MQNKKSRNCRTRQNRADVRAKKAAATAAYKARLAAERAAEGGAA